MTASVLKQASVLKHVRSQEGKKKKKMRSDGAAASLHLSPQRATGPVPA